MKWCISIIILRIFTVRKLSSSMQCTEVRFASFFSGGFITAIVVNPPERRLEKRTSVHWCKIKGLSVGYCERLYVVKNQFVRAKLCM